jgi:hypothetical protein
MMLKPSDAYTTQFTTHDTETGAGTDADSLPTATATRNGTDDATFTLTVTNMATGRYKVAGTVPAGYVDGDLIQIVINATVNSTSDSAIIDHFVIDTKRNSDMVDFDPGSQSVNIGQWAGANVSTTDFSVLTNLDAAISSRSTFDPALHTVTVDDLTSNALAEFFTTNTGSTFSTAIAGSVVSEIVENITTGSGSNDWTDTEKQQIRHRLGLDGDTTIPSNTGDLSDIKNILQAATRK